MSGTIVKVVLAGGIGSRLWPLSRAAFPKQFHAMFGSVPMMTAAARRAARLCDERVLVVGSEAHRFLIADAVKEAGFKAFDILLEPEAKNTAAAIALAALEVAETRPDARMLILPADHWIEDEQALEQALEKALPELGDELVAFGVQPTRAETGYGYIELGEAGSSGAVVSMKRFVEKPDEETAKAYFESNRYLWNSGMFLFPAQKLLEELKAHAPDILSAVTESYERRQRDGAFIRPDPDLFARTRADSIDYAVMERTTSAKVIPVDMNWSDIGSWLSYYEQARAGDHADSAGNVSDGDVVTLDCENNLLVSRKRLVTAIGLKNMAVIETGDAILVMPLSDAQRVKQLLERVQQEERPEAELNAKAHRPWGTYETVDQGPRYQVKRIVVKPGGQLSLQMHHHRSEHWIVVRGTARVTRGSETFMLSENESTYIPLGTVHRIENPGAIPLEFIEVQSGAYLGEDDIVRYEDNYGRCAGEKKEESDA